MRYIVILHDKSNERWLESEDDVKLRYKNGENISIEDIVGSGGLLERVTGDRKLDVERELRGEAISGKVEIDISYGKVCNARIALPCSYIKLDVSDIESTLLSIITDALEDALEE